MKRKVLVVVYIILIFITLKLLYNISQNTILINKYNNGEYSESGAKALTFLDFPESYVAHYNYANIFYQNGKYEEAIEEYSKSLKGYIPKDKECNIRINYALAICKTVDLDENDEQSINNAINQYEQAINVLTENGCANKENNNGHSLKAEQLKKDIQKEIDRLKKLKKQEENDEKEEQEEEKENQSQDESESIEAKIQDIKEQAINEQRENEDIYINLQKDYFGSQGKNW